MTVRGAVATIVGCALLFGAIGATIGYALGTLAPGYYRSVFRTGQNPEFDPASVGVGQGATQGTAGGAILGLAVVAVLCWREIRLQRVGDQSVLAERQPAKSAVVARRVLLATLFALGLCPCVGAGVVVGLLHGEWGAYRRQFLHEQEAIAPILSGDPAFARVELHEYSAGGVYLAGGVPTSEDFDRLYAGIVRAVGEGRAAGHGCRERGAIVVLVQPIYATSAVTK